MHNLQGELMGNVNLRDIYPGFYQRSALPSILSSVTAAGRYTLSVSATAVSVGTADLSIPSTNIDLSVASSWDTTSGTDYTVAANRAGKDFYLYAVSTGLVLSANATVPTGFTSGNSRKIGGFHCLCLSVGAISGHSLTGWLTGDILPASIWDLLWRPVCSPEGMVYSDQAGIWVDIYLQSGTGTSTRSAYAATITDTRTYNDHADDVAAVGKRMLTDLEFQAVALGSNEQTNIAGGSDPVTTEGHRDTTSRRMISNIGVEDAAGSMWQWVDGGFVYRNGDAAYSGAWAWNLAGASRGQVYVQGGTGITGLRAGGDWNSGSLCGSRCRSAYYARSSAASNIGSRGCARSRGA